MSSVISPVAFFTFHHVMPDPDEFIRGAIAQARKSERKEAFRFGSALVLDNKQGGFFSHWENARMRVSPFTDCCPFT
jgi:hypothetical protein